MLSLDKAIKSYEKIAEENEKDAEQFKRIKATQDMISHCYECAQEHRQLAEWLKKLKAYEEAKEKIELKAEKCPQDEIRYGMRSALYVLDKCLEGSESE